MDDQLVKDFVYHLRNPKICYRVHNSPSVVPVLSQMNPAHIFISYVFQICFNQSPSSVRPYLAVFLRCGFVSPRSAPSWRPTACRLSSKVIQYNGSVLPYLETVSSIRSLRTGRALFDEGHASHGTAYT
jgi:hypothetical protein